MSELSRGGWDFSDSAATPAGGLDTLSTAGAGDGPPPPSPPTGVAGGPRYGGQQPGRGDTIRTVIRGVGQTLITLGLVLLLFVVYEVWVSNLFADRKQNQVRHQYANAIKQGQDPLKGEDRLNLPLGKQVVLPAGAGFANLYIPQFGKDFVKTIVQGTDDGDLDRGPGHYANSQLPGQIGNFAVAGHRVGKGEPFLNLDQLHPGDKIVVQTANNWYIYTVLGDQNAYAAALKIGNKSGRDAAITASLSAPDSQGVPGREIVSPNAVQVIAPVPDHPDATPNRALLTLTTCHPKYTANQRMIVHAVLTRAVPDKGSALPKELSGGTL
ncbi:MAG: class E sortase [Actinomycetota bacterium]|nr:class E sortase [Actinomycetota bacterium]MDQ2955383.1 class E sortase [Actinomycetota bacterium]